MVVDPVNQHQKLQLQLYELLIMGVYIRNMLSCLQKYNTLNKSHLVGQLLYSTNKQFIRLYDYTDSANINVNRHSTFLISLITG